MPVDILIHPEIERYIDAMWMEKGLSDNTLSSYRRDLRQFHEWLPNLKFESDHFALVATLGLKSDHTNLH